MDSCGGFGGLDPSTGYYTNAGPMTLAQQNALFDGNDTLINQIAFGDSECLDVCDVYVTFRRSLDPSLTWFRASGPMAFLEAEPISQPNAQVQARAPTPRCSPSSALSFLTNPPVRQLSPPRTSLPPPAKRSRFPSRPRSSATTRCAY